MLTPLMDVTMAQSRLEELQRFVRMYLNEDEDYGLIPGTPKPTLYKPGADKLCDIYGLADTYTVTNRTEDWDKNLFDYEVECRLVSKRTGQLVSSGMGSCNSYEGKYRWREEKRKCPNCNKETIIKGKAEFGGGWICWNKPGKSDGCGAKFKDGDKAIESQAVGKIQNEDIPTLKNTFLKMAKKRAKVDAVLAATRSSGIFTQDIEDMREPVENGSKEAADAVAKAKIDDLKAKTAAQVAAKTLSAKKAPSVVTGPPLARIPANPESLGEIVKGEIKVGGVEAKKTAGGQSYRTVEMVIIPTGEELKLTAFDDHKYQVGSSLFSVLDLTETLSNPCPATFRIRKTGKYVNIVAIERMGNVEFEDGEPVIQRDDSYEPPDEEYPPPAPQAGS